MTTSPSLAQPPKRNIESLTGLRFIAAFLIVILHSYQGFNIPDVRGLLNLGAGVNFFFVLSGFVIAHRYHALSRAELPGYMVSRIARIYPVHLLSLLMYAAFAMSVFPFQYDIAWHQKALVLLSNLTLTQSHIPAPEYYFSINAVSWSLSCELFFYSAAAVLFVNKLDLRKAWLTFLAFLVIALLCLVGAELSSISELGQEGKLNVTKVGIVGTWPLSKAHEFFLGVLLQQLHQRHLGRHLQGRGHAADSLALAVFAASLVASTYLFRSLGLGITAGEFLMTLICSLGSAWLIWVFSQERSVISTRFFGGQTMVTLGEASFALYMIHMPLLRLFQRIHHGEALGVGWWLLYVATCLVSAHLVYTRVEAPARQWIIHRFKARRLNAAVAS